MPPPTTITKKILARAAGKQRVESGEFIEAKVDRLMMHDLTAPLSLEAFKKLNNAKVWDPSRVVIVFDHDVPAQTAQSALLQRDVRRFVAESGISSFYDVGWGGICHQVMPERGHVLPGECIIGADSHSCSYGALGAFATGVGSTDAAAVLATGTIWLKVPEEIRVTVNGKFKPYTYAKDLILHIAGDIGADGANYRAVEFTGSTIPTLTVDSRLTISNMAVEIGAKNGIIPPDEVTLRYVKERTTQPFTPLHSDADAHYEQELEYNVDSLEPQVACPHAVDNVKPVAEVGNVEIHEAFLGSCTNARLEDLRIAAKMLKGRRVKGGVRMIVTPASQQIYGNALREGLLDIFVAAGAFVTGSTCGACIGRHQGIPADGEVVVSSANRNFPGRMGNPKAEVYLASPATVAASAILGRLAHPREVETS